MKKGVILILGLLLLTGCNKYNTDLEHSIDSVVKSESENKIIIKPLTNFEWDKGFLFHPYSTEKSINDELKIRFKHKSKIDQRDDIYLLVFLNEDKAVQYVEIKRNDTDFSIGDQNYITPNNDIIDIKRH